MNENILFRELKNVRANLWMNKTSVLMKMPVQMTCQIMCKSWDNQDVLQFVNTHMQVEEYIEIIIAGL